MEGGEAVSIPSVGAYRTSGGGGTGGGWGGAGGVGLAGQAKATKMLHFVGRYPGRGERFVWPLASDGGSRDLAGVSPNCDACVFGQKRLESAGGGYPALWLSRVSLPVGRGGGLEPAEGWYKGQLAQTLRLPSVGVSRGATRGVRPP